MAERFLGKKKAGSSILPSGSQDKENKFMAKKKKPFIKLQCEVCKRTNYFTNKPKAMVEEKLNLKKFCKWCRKHTLHKEGKR